MSFCQIGKRSAFEVEASHHEVAPSQHEIDFKYADALEAADNIQTLQTGSLKRLPAKHGGLYATFMPKTASWYPTVAGCIST